MPPTVSYDTDGVESAFEVHPPQQFRTVDHVQIYPPAVQAAAPAQPPLQPSDPISNSFSQSFSYDHPSYLDLTTSQPALSQYDSVPSSSLPAANYSFQHAQAFDDDYQHPAGDLAWNGTDVGTEVSTDNLTEAMGELSIDHTGVGEC